MISNNIFSFGSNRTGQLGYAYIEDITSIPLLLTNLTFININRITTSNNYSEIITSDGSLLNCGENENNQLCRNGKKSLFGRVDVLESFTVVDVTRGNGFALVVCNDGRLMTWGRNDFGQLGNGTREFKEKPRFNHPFRHRIIQISAGSEHVVALSSVGLVLTWGGNRKGQLGDGQFTSRCEPQFISELKHRPIASIYCGESHSLALTAGGDVYSWGENSQGQLGLGDTKNRLRPEIIRSLKTVNCIKICAGGNHSLIISYPEGLLFAFGSNSFGQLGLGLGLDLNDQQELQPYEQQDKVYTSPIVVDRLRDYYVVDVAAGLGHTLIVCKTREEFQQDDNNNNINLNNSIYKVYSMGLNTSGQCGLGHYRNVTRPTLVQFPELTLNNLTSPYVSVHSGPLSYHSFVCFTQYEMKRQKLPSVDLAALEKVVNQYNLNQQQTTLITLREMIAESFSSLSVLNSSFRIIHSNNQQHREQHHQQYLHQNNNHGGHIDLDLDAVRKAYQLIFSTKSEQVLSTLGRTLLLVADHMKECPFDTPENLHVFIIVLENPLLLQPDKFHIVLQRLVTGILAIPKSYRIMFFGWLKHFSSEYFSHIVLVMETFLTFILTNKSSGLDPTPVVLVIESLFTCNQESGIIPVSLFCNQALPRSINIYEEWEKYKTLDVSKIFNFFSYPFLFPIEAKNNVIRSEFRSQTRQQNARHFNKYLIQSSETSLRPLPRGVVIKPSNEDPFKINILMELVVNRHNLLETTKNSLQAILHDDISTLMLPLTVKFEGEDAVDAGGVTKEFFTLIIREFLQTSNLLQTCGDYKHLWFTGINNNDNNNDINSDNNNLFDEYLLGLLLGLACYNGVLVNLPIAPVVYKLFNELRPTLEDLWGADSSLARGLQMLLDYNEDGTSFTEIFGITFQASINPLIDTSLSNTESSTSTSSSTSTPKFVDLIPNGSEIQVTRANRKEFVNLFVQHTLYKSCETSIEKFLSGLRTILFNQVLSICTSTEIETVICGSSDLLDLDLKELRKHTNYLGIYHDNHPVIEMFWSVIYNLTIPQFRQFLFFVTATDRLPIGGLNQIRLTIQSTFQPPIALPVAHTCFNILDLPSSYESIDQLKDRLFIALEHCQGFGLA